MITASIAFVLAFFTSLFCTPPVKRLAGSVGALDALSARKIHARVVPRLGGLAIAAAFYLPLLGLLVVDSEMGRLFSQSGDKVLGLLGGGLIIIGLGIYDDIAGANAQKKFFVQFAVGLLLYVLGFRIGAVTTPFGGVLELGVFDLPITLLWIVGVINAINLIDGLDGLASGVAFFAAATTLVVAFITGNTLMILFMATLTGAVAGFLVYNFHPASIFMGDTGSMFLGYVIGVTALQTNIKGPATVAVLTPLLALGLPILDTSLAMLRRFLRGRSMFQADREHIHHRLLALGLSHRGAVLALYGVSLLLAVAGVLVTSSNGRDTAIVLGATVTVVVLFLLRLSYVKRSGPHPPSRSLTEQRRRNRVLRELAQELASHMPQVSDLDSLWTATLPVGAALAAARMRLELPLTDEAGRRVFAWSAASTSGPTTYSATFQLALGSGAGALSLDWSDGRLALDPDDEVVIATLVDHLIATWLRLQHKAAQSRGSLHA